MMWNGYHWWWPGPVLMAAFMVGCVALMALMMGHMGHRHGRMSTGTGGMLGARAHSQGRHETRTAEQILDERLARGEIDIKDYRQIHETLAENSSAGGRQEWTISGNNSRANE